MVTVRRSIAAAADPTLEREIEGVVTCVMKGQHVKYWTKIVKGEDKSQTDNEDDSSGSIDGAGSLVSGKKHPKQKRETSVTTNMSMKQTSC